MYSGQRVKLADGRMGTVEKVYYELDPTDTIESEACDMPKAMFTVLPDGAKPGYDLPFDMKDAAKMQWF